MWRPLWQAASPSTLGPSSTLAARAQVVFGFVLPALALVLVFAWPSLVACATTPLTFPRARAAWARWSHRMAMCCAATLPCLHRSRGWGGTSARERWMFLGLAAAVVVLVLVLFVYTIPA